MIVCSEVELTVAATAKHLREMKSAAERITDDQSSVRVWVDKDRPKSVLAEYTIPKARQMDVVNNIMHEFALYMEDYSTQSLWFPPPPRKRQSKRKPNKKIERTTRSVPPLTCVVRLNKNMSLKTLSPLCTLCYKELQYR